MKIGITGQDGFIGYHLYQTIKYKFKEYEIVPFERPFLENNKLLDSFVSSCDLIVHLAGVNRANSEEEVYSLNIQINTPDAKHIKQILVILSKSPQEIRLEI